MFACVAILGLHQACFVARLLSAQIRSTMLAVFFIIDKSLSGVHDPEQFFNTKDEDMEEEEEVRRAEQNHLIPWQAAQKDKKIEFHN